MKYNIDRIKTHPMQEWAVLLAQLPLGRLYKQCLWGNNIAAIT